MKYPLLVLLLVLGCAPLPPKEIVLDLPQPHIAQPMNKALPPVRHYMTPQDIAESTNRLKRDWDLMKDQLSIITWYTENDIKSLNWFMEVVFDSMDPDLSVEEFIERVRVYNKILELSNQILHKEDELRSQLLDLRDLIRPLRKP
jgi:hypothetical protein